MQPNHDENLKALFFDAFASRPRPTATQILRPGVSPHEGNDLRELLASKTSTELTDYELRTVVESNLWMLTPEAFLYFLPAFLHASLESYASVSIFASELIGALTKPSRADVVEGLDQIARSSSELRLPDDLAELLRKQQLEWFDSGTPMAIFHERFDNLTHSEGAAVLAFLLAFQEAHGADFPFDELETAVDRYWARYRAS
jgi:hypothetical protein